MATCSQRFAALGPNIVIAIINELMDRASQALAQRLPSDVPRTYAVLAEQGEVPLYTLQHRARSKKKAAQSQQHLILPEKITFLGFCF